MAGPQPPGDPAPHPRGYREPHPVRAAAVLGGVAAGLFWLWVWTAYAPPALGQPAALAAGLLLGSAAAAVLVRAGDRGVAAGLALGLAGGAAVACAAAWSARW
ncbi:MAG TPA: hypothetical protein VFY17_10780 [Pilimelia sp.]|nr:hypothetical protein [Pilimelia sp.]